LGGFFLAFSWLVVEVGDVVRWELNMIRASFGEVWVGGELGWGCWSGSGSGSILGRGTG
jgi:hypothetical protein